MAKESLGTCWSKYPFRGNILHTRSRHLRKSSWISSGIFQWIFSGIFQRILNRQWYCPRDCHLSNIRLLEIANEFSMAFSNGISLLWFLVCNILPWPSSRYRFGRFRSLKYMPGEVGRHYLSNATCLMRPRSFSAFFVVSRIIIICQTIRNFSRNPALDK